MAKRTEQNPKEKLQRQVVEHAKLANPGGPRQLRAIFHPPSFAKYAPPLGFIPLQRGAHALFYYALLARKNYEELIVDPIFVEGEVDLVPNFKQLFTSIATMYGTTPEEMIPFWSNVDMQFSMLKLPKLPEGDQYRFNVTPSIVTETKQ